jgi:hypothetical protein
MFDEDYASSDIVALSNIIDSEAIHNGITAVIVIRTKHASKKGWS